MEKTPLKEMFDDNTQISKSVTSKDQKDEVLKSNSSVDSEKVQSGNSGSNTSNDVIVINDSCDETWELQEKENLNNSINLIQQDQTITIDDTMSPSSVEKFNPDKINFQNSFNTSTEINNTLEIESAMIYHDAENSPTPVKKMDEKNAIASNKNFSIKEEHMCNQENEIINENVTPSLETDNITLHNKSAEKNVSISDHFSEGINRMLQEIENDVHNQQPIEITEFINDDQAVPQVIKSNNNSVENISVSFVNESTCQEETKITCDEINSISGTATSKQQDVTTDNYSPLNNTIKSASGDANNTSCVSKETDITSQNKTVILDVSDSPENVSLSPRSASGDANNTSCISKETDTTSQNKTAILDVSDSPANVTLSPRIVSDIVVKSGSDDANNTSCILKETDITSPNKTTILDVSDSPENVSLSPRTAIDIAVKSASDDANNTSCVSEETDTTSHNKTAILDASDSPANLTLSSRTVGDIVVKSASDDANNASCVSKETDITSPNKTTILDVSDSPENASLSPRTASDIAVKCANGDNTSKETDISSRNKIAILDVSNSPENVSFGPRTASGDANNKSCVSKETDTTPQNKTVILDVSDSSASIPLSPRTAGDIAVPSNAVEEINFQPVCVSQQNASNSDTTTDNTRTSFTSDKNVRSSEQNSSQEVIIIDDDDDDDICFEDSLALPVEQDDKMEWENIHSITLRAEQDVKMEWENATFMNVSAEKDMYEKTLVPEDNKVQNNDTNNETCGSMLSQDAVYTTSTSEENAHSSVFPGSSIKSPTIALDETLGVELEDTTNFMLESVILDASLKIEEFLCEEKDEKIIKDVEQGVSSSAENENNATGNHNLQGLRSTRNSLLSRFDPLYLSKTPDKSVTGTNSKENHLDSIDEKLLVCFEEKPQNVKEDLDLSIGITQLSDKPLEHTNTPINDIVEGTAKDPHNDDSKYLDTKLEENFRQEECSFNNKIKTLTNETAGAHADIEICSKENQKLPNQLVNSSECISDSIKIQCSEETYNIDNDKTSQEISPSEVDKISSDKEPQAICETVNSKVIKRKNKENSSTCLSKNPSHVSPNTQKNNQVCPKKVLEENKDIATKEVNTVLTGKIMADVSDKLAVQEEENAELKLQLNASQQVRATLELQVRQKEEIIIKSQAEALRKDQTYKQEIKQLKEKLEEKCSENDSSQLKDLQETAKTLKSREAKLISELNARKNDEQNYRKIMDEYEKTIGTRLAELQKLNEEHETVKRHLANLELAFSDVHQKYERSKKIIDGYKCNEDALRQTLVTSEDSVIKSEEKYESLKAHAKAQIEKSNQEMQLMREQYESEIHKLSAIIRRLEIKNASLADSLDQKKKECSALAALCDEVTGKV